MNSNDYTKEQIDRMRDGAAEIVKDYIHKMLKLADELGIDRDFALGGTSAALFVSIQRFLFCELDLSEFEKEAQDE